MCLEAQPLLLNFYIIKMRNRKKLITDKKGAGRSGMKMKKLIPIGVASIFCIPLVIIISFALLIFWIFSSFPGDADLPSDCAIVFGAAVHRKNKAGPGINRRMETAIGLYNADQINRLILTGGRGDDYQHSEASVMNSVAIAGGVAEKDIIMEEKSGSTWENLLYTKPLTEDCESVIGISDRYHLARIKLIAAKQGWGSLQTYPAQTLAPSEFEMFSVIREALGVVYYMVYTPQGD